MGDGTGIEWCDATWNPVGGCSRISEGCRHCYAEQIAGRFSGPGQAFEGLARRVLKVVNADERDPGNRTEGRWTGEMRFYPKRLSIPLRWKRPRRVFVNSMSDLFHEKLTDEQIDQVVAVMALARQHTYQTLTKRADRMRAYFAADNIDQPSIDGRMPLSWRLARAAEKIDPKRFAALGGDSFHWHPRRWPWTWWGTSIENQAAADERLPELVESDVDVLFLSCEPLLGSVDVTPALWDGDRGVRWVIAGCESGRGARPCDPAWLQSLRDQCAAAGVAYFLKQAVDVAVPNGRGGFHSAITFGPGTHAKGIVLGAPYLDGAQHLAFPEVPSG